jgi:arylsulfatase A-like enzyme
MLYGQAAKPPNIVIILADDLGYGDVGCFGSDLPTPNLDRMAADGVRLERFYSASPVCSPSRAALLTGRYAVRSGVTNVLMPSSPDGLSASEQTIPKLLKERGYRTAMVGKWHLGTRPDRAPNSCGFDEFYGLPYSNDMFPLPMLRNGDVVDPSPRQANLTERFTSQAVDFINRNRDNPFVLYLAHTAPHIPLAPSERFAGKSEHGPYGDVVAELDWSVGEVLKAVRDAGIDGDTLVVFTSDNGPWYQGSAGRLRGRKGSTYEGGVRVPFIARFPGRIPSGSASHALTSMMDLLPTVVNLAGRPYPADLVDGVDVWPVLTGEKAYAEREALLFFDGQEIQAVRWGPWKLHVSRYNSHAWTMDPPGGRVNLPLNPPELYHIDSDGAEAYDRASEKPEVVADLLARIDRLLLGMPEQVRTAWRDTRNRRVIQTPAGALPQRPD